MATDMNRMVEVINRLNETEKQTVFEFACYLAFKKRAESELEDISEDDEWVADNGPLTEYEKKAIEQAEKDIANGDYMTWEDIKREIEI